MPSYNRIAGNSVERLAALSDGIFAVAMTLLVLELHGPVREMVHSELELWQGLGAMAPQLATYLMSFLTLGIFWNGQQAQLNHMERSDRHLTWIHLAFLFAVSVMPFSTKLLAEFIRFRTALLCYWFNIFLLGATLYMAWRCAVGEGHLKPDTPTEVNQAIVRRIFWGQGLYAAGALLCLVDPYVSIGFIVLVQVNFAVGLMSKF
ncbi:MAG: TMEM175 family protein [Bryobacteraceae bacterium]|jgi:uncharacterized membrane protein